MSDQTKQDRATKSTAAGATASDRSTSDRVSFFDMGRQPELPAGGDPTKALLHTQILLNHRDDDGFSLLAVRLEPDVVVPHHSHNLPQVVLVLEGELRQGNRVIGPGCGYFTPVGSTYTVTSGPEGAKVLEFRSASLSSLTTDWRDGYDPSWALKP